MTIKPECLEKFAEAASENVRCSRMEEGVINFTALQNKEEQTEFILIEIYRTPEDQNRHRETEHYQIFKAQIQDLLQEPYQAKIYSSVI